jgi:hypothetical protein
MKPFFNPAHGILALVSAGITWVCAGLLTRDSSGALLARSYSIWGDWSAHFTFIESFRERGVSWILQSNPLFLDEPFRYPFLSHLLTALASFFWGGDAISAAYWTSLILLFALPFLLYRFYLSLGFEVRSSLVGTLIFLLMGGFQWADPTLSSTEPLTNQFKEGSFFTQFVLFELFPQRAFLFGLTLFLILFTRLLNARKWTLRESMITGFSFGILLLVHVHSWLAMGAWLLHLFVFPPKPGISRKSFLHTGLLALAASSLGLWFIWFRGTSPAPSWDLWLPGWAQNPKAGFPLAAEMGFLRFWMYNTGLFLPLAVAGIFLSWKHSRFRALAVTGSLLFIIPLFINLQPYFYDNLKTFTYSFLFLAPFVGTAWSSLGEIPRLPKVLRFLIPGALLLAQTASAVLDFAAFDRGIQNTLFFSSEEMTLAKQFKEIRNSSDDLTLIDPKHNHWVPCLTGTPVLMGYPGWLWSWGIPYGARELEVKEILAGGPRALEWVRKYGLKYAVLQGPDSTGFFESHFRKVLESRNWRVYSLTETLKSPAPSVR